MNANDKFITRKDIEIIHRVFLLFGDPASPHWMLGLEEAEYPEKQSIDEFVETLIIKAKKFSQAEKMSLRDFGNPKGSPHLPAIDETLKRHTSDTEYQRTWGGYIKLVLSINSLPNDSKWTREGVKLYQKYNLGTLTSRPDPRGICLLELFPMGLKNRNEWPYEELSKRDGLGFLKNRSSYRREVVGGRVDKLLDLVEKHQPKYLFCFGADCRVEIRKILKEDITTLKIDSGKKYKTALLLLHGKTTIVFLDHPTLRDTSDLYWRNLGTQLASIGFN